MEVQGFKPKLKHGLGGFGCISIPPVVRGELKSQVSLVRIGLVHPDPASTDQVGVGFEGGRKLEIPAWMFLLLIEKHLYKFLRFLGSAPAERVKALVARIRLIRQYFWPITGLQFT